MNPKTLIGMLALSCALCAQAADDLVLQHNVPVAYTNETLAVGRIVYPAGAYKNPGIGSLTLENSTMTATSVMMSKDNWQTGFLTLRNHSSLTLSGKSYFACNTYGYGHGLITVDGGSSLSFNEVLTIGCGAYNANTGSAEIRAQDSTLSVTGNLDWMGRGTWKMTNCVFTSTAGTGNAIKFASLGGSYAAAGAAGITNRVEFVDTDFTYGGQFQLALSVPGTMLLSGGTFTLGNSWCLSSWNTKAETPAIPNLTSSVVMTNGAVATVNGGAVAIGAGVTTHGSMAVADGSSLTAKTVYVGGYGEGRLTVDATSRVKATDGFSIAYGDTGTGTVTVAGTVAAKSVVGGSGESTFVSNGGTIEMLADGKIFNNVDTVTIGAAGLTVDTQKHAVTLNQSLTGGPVTFSGGGTVTIAAGVTIDDFDAAGGTKIVYEEEGTTETITVTAPGVETRTTDIAFNGNDTRIFDIASGSGLTVSGKVGIGAVEKRGGGILTLDNPQDKFVGGLTLTAGTLGFGDDAPAKVNAAFAIGNTTAKTLTVVKNDADLTMNFPDGTLKGAFLKRGAGELVWERNTSWAQYNDLTGPDTAATLDPAAPLDFGDGTVLPTDNFVAFSVVEGRFTLRGTSSGRNLWRSLGVVWAVGTPVTACAAQPELVFDHMSAEIAGGLHVGAGLGAGTPVLEPKLIVRDSSLTCTYSTAKYVTDVALRPSVLVSNSTVTTSMMCLNGGYDAAAGKTIGSAKVRATHRYEAGSLLLTGLRLEYLHPTTLAFDNSTLSGTSKGTAATLYGQYNCSTNTTSFANGSRFCFAGAVDTPSSGIHITTRQTFVFDDSTMDPCTTADFTYDVNTQYFNMYFEVLGKGLVFEPAAGQTITMTEALHGTGGFVNRGEGTSVLADGVVQYTGVTRAEAGAVDFGGATLAGAKIAGPGAFKNGTLETPTLALAMDGAAVADAPALDLANGLALTGAVTVDLGLKPGEMLKLVGGKHFPVLTVATYTGSVAPDVSNWKLKRGQGIRGTFAAADGVVTCTTASVPGLCIIFR